MSVAPPRPAALGDAPALQRLLAPLAADEFFARYWERAPLVLRREKPAFYDELLPQRSLAELVWRAGLGWGEVQLANSNRGDGWIDLTRNPPDVHVLQRALQQGDTVVVNDVQTRDLRVATLCRELEDLFEGPVNANAYLTPAGCFGLAPHYDAQDVFVMQLDGEKTWQLFGGVVDLPTLASDTPVPPQTAQDVVLEVTLRPGDLLYLPRGTVHAASTGEGPSFHLTLGLTVLAWRDLLESMLRLAAERSVALRRALPPAMLRQAGVWAAAVPAELEPLVESLAALVPLDDARSDLARRWMNALKPLPSGHLSATAAPAVTLESILRRREGMICRFSGSPGVGIVFPGGDIRVDERGLEGAFRFVAEHDTFAVGELPESLSESSKRVLAETLIAHGVYRLL